MDFFCDVIIWYVFLIGLILMLLPSSIFASISQIPAGTFPPAVSVTGKVMAIAGAVGLLLMSGRANKNVALRLALGTSWIFLVSGEMVGSQSGLGFLIMDTKNCMRFDSLLATMLTIGVIGFILDGFLRIAEKLIRTKFGFGA